MNYKITSIIIPALLTHVVCNGVPFTLYNSLPYTLYYAIHDATSSGQTFIALDPYATVQLDLKGTRNIEASIVKEIPQAGQEIPLHTITVSAQSLVDLKTYKTIKGNIRLIPQSTVTKKNPAGMAPITHHDILLTKATYKPVYIPQETPQTQNNAIAEQNITPTIETADQQNGAIQEQPQNSDILSSTTNITQEPCTKGTADATCPLTTVASASASLTQETESHL